MDDKQWTGIVCLTKVKQWYERKTKLETREWTNTLRKNFHNSFTFASIWFFPIQFYHHILTDSLRLAGLKECWFLLSVYKKLSCCKFDRHKHDECGAVKGKLTSSRHNVCIQHSKRYIHSNDLRFGTKFISHKYVRRSIRLCIIIQINPNARSHDRFTAYANSHLHSNDEDDGDDGHQTSQPSSTSFLQ